MHIFSASKTNAIHTFNRISAQFSRCMHVLFTCKTPIVIKSEVVAFRISPLSICNVELQFNAHYMHTANYLLLVTKDIQR